jgi:hypothetical protein
MCIANDHNCARCSLGWQIVSRYSSFGFFHDWTTKIISMVSRSWLTAGITVYFKQSPDDLAKALFMIPQRNISILGASKRRNIPRRTLGGYVKSKSSTVEIRRKLFL